LFCSLLFDETSSFVPLIPLNFRILITTVCLVPDKDRVSKLIKRSVIVALSLKF